jgi:hypothetical protein
MAIAAQFDLELIQYNVVNAFVHAKLPYKIYIRIPLGYEKSGTVLLLRKALYGLKESPLLWQRHFSASLRREGYLLVPHKPCYFTKNGIVIFFYIDDIVVAYGKERKRAAVKLIEHLAETYKL